MCGFDSCYPCLSKKKFIKINKIASSLQKKINRKYVNNVLKYVEISDLIKLIKSPHVKKNHMLFTFKDNFIFNRFSFETIKYSYNKPFLFKFLSNTNPYLFFILPLFYHNPLFLIKNSFFKNYSFLFFTDRLFLNKSLYNIFINFNYNFFNRFLCSNNLLKLNYSLIYRKPVIFSLSNKIFKTKTTVFYNFTFFGFFLNFFFKTKKKNTFLTYILSRFDFINKNFAKLNKNTVTFNNSDVRLWGFKNLLKSPLIKLLYKSTWNDFFFQNHSILVNQSNHYSITTKQNPSIPFFNFFKNPQLSHSNNYSNFTTFSNMYRSPLNSLHSIMILFFKPLFFKYFRTLIGVTDFTPFNLFSNFFLSSFFYSYNLVKRATNILPNAKFTYLIKKTVLKLSDFNKFADATTPVHHYTLIKFLEHCSGKKAHIRINGFVNSVLSFEERARCLLWSQKVKYFRKVLGPKLFLNESIQIMYLSLRDKDPYILSNWMVTTMYKLSFWKYKTFLRYIKYVLRYFFWGVFKDLDLRGIKFQLKGKISVAGNARTRTAYHYVGFTSHATFDNRILYNLSLVRSFTGVMGLKLWIVF